MRREIWVLAAFALAAAGGTLVADDVPAAVGAVKENVVFTVDVTGTFDAAAPVEVSQKMQAYADELEVLECIPGGPVEKGALLVRFKPEKMEEAVRAAERDLGVAKAQLAAQTEDQRRQGESTAVALAKAELDAKNAKNALDHFVSLDRPLRLEESVHGIAGTKNWITDQTEELAQLEKMYKADDLVEGTEEIVMTRAKRELERSRKILDFQERRAAVLREIDLPRELESLTFEARNTASGRDRLNALTKLQAEQQKLELDRTRANVELQEKAFAKLKADSEKLTVTAPEAGVAVPGALVRGRWTTLDDVRKGMKKGGKFRGTDVLFTIVQPGAVRVVATVPETSVLSLKPGMDAQIVPNAAPGALLAAKLVSVSPVASGTEFEVVLDLTEPDARLLPGYGCKVRIATAPRAAILVPSGAIEDGFEKAVHVLVNGKPERRAVRTGASKDGKVEIVSGLAEGDRVLETPPKK